MLNEEAVERLRAAIASTRAQRRMGLKEIASATGVPEHTVRNFAYRRSNRPNNWVLGKLYKYFAERSELLPSGLLALEGSAGTSSAEPALTQRAEQGGRLESGTSKSTKGGQPRQSTARATAFGSTRFQGGATTGSLDGCSMPRADIKMPWNR